MGEQATNCHARRKGVIDRVPHVGDCDMTDEGIATSSQNSPLDSSLTEVLCGRLASEEFVVRGDNEAYFIVRQITISYYVQCQFHSAHLFRRRCSIRRTFMILFALPLYLYAFLIRHPTFNPPSRRRRHPIFTFFSQVQPSARNRQSSVVRRVAN